MKVILATGNNQKFELAAATCRKFGIELEQADVKTDEIQGEDPSTIVEHKAQAKFAALGKPVLVSDDSWSIPGLNGFPGPYMKSINHWFTPDDFIRLTRDLTDRRVILQQYIAYCDGAETVIFNQDATGTLLTEPRGHSEPTCTKVFTMDRDGGLSISEIYDQGAQARDSRVNTEDNVWLHFAKWYQANHPTK